MAQFIWIIILIILIAYAVILYRITGKNRGADKLMWAFMIVAILGFFYHMYLFNIIAKSGFMQFENLLSEALFSVQYSLDMFIANTIIFRGEVMNIIKNNPLLFFIYLPIYGMALLTSGFAIFHFLSRKLYNWFWLTLYKKNAFNNKSHIFIGVNRQSCCLAKDIFENNVSEQIIFIDIPDETENPHGISVWDIISRFFKGNKENEELNKYVVLKADKGLKKLTHWLMNENNNVYILSENQGANLSMLIELWEHTEFKSKIYCHAKKEGLINRYNALTDVDDRINFVDSSLLAVEYLKKDDTGKLLPVNYVDIAQNEFDGRNLGYVTSAFNCAIIGFGETGKEAFNFLYEFASFPDKDNEKAPFLCHIFDADIEKEARVELESLRSSTAKDNEIKFHSCRIDSRAFYTQIMDIIGELNYIVICLGDDNLNLETALNIVKYAEIKGCDTSNNFCVVVKQSNVNKLNQKTLENANVVYNNCIHTFGMLDTIWKKDIISNEKFEKDARLFFDSYTALSKELLYSNNYDEPDTWEKRNSKITDINYECRCKARRQRAQDYSNVLHKTTKQILCASCDALAKTIYAVNKGTEHCEPENKAVLEHLAVCEHLRWEASHLILGYRPTTGKTNDLKKLHNCIKPYSELDAVTQHFDWLVVKNSIS